MRLGVSYAAHEGGDHDALAVFAPQTPGAGSPKRIILRPPHQHARILK
jgi:hypothetical protein